MDAPARTRLSDVGAVLLDMDGTLLDSEHASGACWVEWAGRRGKDPAAVLAVVRGRKASDSMHDLAPELSEAERRADIDAFEVAERTMTDGIVALDGSARLLGALRDLGVPHALVTSAGTALAGVRMGAAGLRSPEVAVHGDEVGRSKPDPEGFLAAAALLGVGAETCVVLEDSPAGVEAARAAGMRVIGVGEAAADLSLDAWAPHPAAVDVVRDTAGVALAVSRG